MIFLPMVCIFLTHSLFSAVVHADRPGNKIQLSTQQVTLLKKTAKMVMSTIGDQYQIGPAALIIGQNGGQVHINKLLVPCDVKLTYEAEADGKTVHRIDVLNVHEGASDRMWRAYR
jgi:hypothetical protein